MPKSKFSPTGDPPRLGGQFGNPSTSFRSKRPEKGHVHVCIFPWIFLQIYFKGLPKN